LIKFKIKKGGPNMKHADKCENEKKDRCSSTLPSPGDAILRCCSGGAGPLPIINTTLSMPIPIVSVSIDTTPMSDPILVLTFIGQINLLPSMSVNLNFIVRRSTNGSSPQQIGGTYTFMKTVSSLESASFSFQLFDSDSYPSYSTYSVELSTTSIIAPIVGLTISNASLSALAVAKG
jgi:hypothetical protein